MLLLYRCMNGTRDENQSDYFIDWYNDKLYLVNICDFYLRDSGKDTNRGCCLETSYTFDNCCILEPE